MPRLRHATHVVFDRPADPLRGDSPRQRPALPADAPHGGTRRRHGERRARHQRRQRSSGRVEAGGRHANPAEHGRREAQRHLFAERGEMPCVQALTHRHAHLELAQALVHRLDLRGLLPRRRHQRFLMLLNDLRAERRRRPPAGIQVQLSPASSPRRASPWRARRTSGRTAAARAADPRSARSPG